MTSPSLSQVLYSTSLSINFSSVIIFTLHSYETTMSTGELLHFLLLNNLVRNSLFVLSWACTTTLISSPSSNICSFLSNFHFLLSSCVPLLLTWISATTIVTFMWQFLFSTLACSSSIIFSLISTSSFLNCITTLLSSSLSSIISKNYRI